MLKISGCKSIKMGLIGDVINHLIGHFICGLLAHTSTLTPTIDNFFKQTFSDSKEMFFYT